MTYVRRTMARRCEVQGLCAALGADGHGKDDDGARRESFGVGVSPWRGTGARPCRRRSDIRSTKTLCQPPTCSRRDARCEPWRTGDFVYAPGCQRTHALIQRRSKRSNSIEDRRARPGSAKGVRAQRQRQCVARKHTPSGTYTTHARHTSSSTCTRSYRLQLQRHTTTAPCATAPLALRIRRETVVRTAVRESKTLAPRAVARGHICPKSGSVI